VLLKWSHNRAAEVVGLYQEGTLVQQMAAQHRLWHHACVYVRSHDLQDRLAVLAKVPSPCRRLSARAPALAKPPLSHCRRHHRT
jgi:hypothetical protein